MPAVLITGAFGFTGRYLTRDMEARGFKVVGLGQKAESGDAIACDLTDPDAVHQAVRTVQPDYVVHLAALSFVGHPDKEAFYRVNVLGTLNLLHALDALDAAPKKIVIASSANVYGANAREVIDEGICPAPVNHYACSKLAMEHMVRTWFDRLPIVITRPFNYTGAGQDERFLIPKIVSHFRRGAASIELGNIDISRDFSDVRDVARAYQALLASDVHSETFNICSGKAVSLKWIIEELQTIAGYDIEVRVNPDFVRSNDIPVLQGSNEKLSRLVGYTPGISLGETLRWMFEYE
ncbi:nucleoside-diphosphate-sugar epimerase [Desulfosalsimonas propionicica]|uniref:Nucleoside-diphosphate-sugar epimerase n=1 Tax=Desulfosalsimonas propionicica TaxID=332175 RepID=A0A7W0HJB5_9BACT|nr:GDP-mannose 4,6-dehydratase [Desulfosalsimonas propionicica]MBA2880010.1 nucleoside-diphosphate-sugar epimerase [Desulfosalsimonas propionicica]